MSNMKLNKYLSKQTDFNPVRARWYIGFSLVTAKIPITGPCSFNLRGRLYFYGSPSPVMYITVMAKSLCFCQMS